MHLHFIATFLRAAMPLSPRFMTPSDRGRRFHGTLVLAIGPDRSPGQRFRGSAAAVAAAPRDFLDVSAAQNHPRPFLRRSAATEARRNDRGIRSIVQLSPRGGDRGVSVYASLPGGAADSMKRFCFDTCREFLARSCYCFETFRG